MKLLPRMQQNADCQLLQSNASTAAPPDNYHGQGSNPLVMSRFTSMPTPTQNYHFYNMPVNLFNAYGEHFPPNQVSTLTQVVCPQLQTLAQPMPYADNFAPLASPAPQLSYHIPEYAGISGRQPTMPSPILTLDQRSFTFSRADGPPVRDRAMSELSLLTNRSGKRLYEVSLHTEQDAQVRQFAYRAADVPLEQLAAIMRNSETTQNNTHGIATSTSSNIRASASLYPIKNDDIYDQLNALAKNSKEKARQVFGMVWLLGACRVTPKETVSRGSVYSCYGRACAANTLTPLLPVSFGKIIRILYPHLTTRRLGMRGHSKYHYCGIKLIQEDPDASVQEPVIAEDAKPPVSVKLNTCPQLPRSSIASSSLTSSPHGSTGWTALPHDWNIHLRYVPDLFTLSADSEFQLPLIYAHLPPEISYEVADTLYSLYKAHAQTCLGPLAAQQPGKLVASYSCFSAALSEPVWQLYTSDYMLEWVRECEMAILNQHVRHLACMLINYTWSAESIKNLKLVAHTYIGDLSVSLRQTGVPSALSDLKIGMAKTFVSYLTRMIRVIEMGQRAQTRLQDTSKRQIIVRDWLTLDLGDLVRREIPSVHQCSALVLSILKEEVPALLNGQYGMTGTESCTNFLECSDETSPLMTKLVLFLSELPGRFLLDSPRLFQMLASNFLTLCMREMSITNQKGFESWWVLRCWADEFLAWTFELGGFMSRELRQLLILLQPWAV